MVGWMGGVVVEMKSWYGFQIHLLSEIGGV